MLLNPYIKDKLILIKTRLIINIVYFDLSLFILTFYINFVFELSELISLLVSYYHYLKNKKNNYDFVKNKKIKILRIEDNEGIGIYSSNIELLNHTHSEKHPTPYFDFKDIWIHLLFTNKYKEYKFGFKDLQQLNNWVTLEEQKLLFDNGFRIKEYYTKNYYISAKQLIFK